MRQSTRVFAVFCLFLATCQGQNKAQDVSQAPQLLVLGIAQDAGFPQAGCKRGCCQPAWADPELRRWVSCLALLDPAERKQWLLDCPPTLPDQLEFLRGRCPWNSTHLDGVFLTHAHIGHYTGLMHLGREVMGVQGVAVYAMPRMRQFLEQNGPWSLLVRLNNIALKPLEHDQAISLSKDLRIKPLRVPHRDEFSETVAFIVSGPTRKALFLPDIDKWDRWDRSIESVISGVDIAFLDGTFFDGEELPGRDMSQIPHPFISESLERFRGLPERERNKVHFIHLNHTNPALREGSVQAERIRAAGMHVARQGFSFSL